MRNRNFALAVAPLLAAVATISAAPAGADVKAGVDAWSRGNYEAAIREWRPLAERGNPDAQFNLAQAYRLGRGVPADLARAEELFGKAATKGHLRASDNYGVLLFQRGERARAMPYLAASAGRGDPRAQYLLGLAHFNGDNVAKDWVRAYALLSLAQQAGLPQAVPALAQMDKYIPIDQRQQSVQLAASLAAEARATRERQSAADALSHQGSAQLTATPDPAARMPEIVSAQTAVAAAARAADARSPRTTGADYLRRPAPAAVTPPRPQSTRPAAPPSPVATPAAQPTPQPRDKPVSQAALQPATTSVSRKAATPTPRSAASASAPTSAPKPATAASWRVQLGAFGVAANAEALWNRVKGRPELAGRSKLAVPSGRLTKLQAAGFASEREAAGACARLIAAGFSCIVSRD